METTVCVLHCLHPEQACAVQSPRYGSALPFGAAFALERLHPCPWGDTAGRHDKTSSGVRDFLLTTFLLLLSAGSAYYDNVRPLAYPDSDAVLICFDISRPETLDSVLKKWQGETQEFCPNAKIVLVGCKLDMRTDLNTLRELSKQRLIPVTHEQGSALARQIGAVAYAECSSKVSENSVRDVFHVTTLASVNRVHKNLKRSNSKRGLKRASQMPGRTDLLNDTEIRKDRAKSCSIM
ncbi:PREDICTED: rho-related GTP-binding protein RhoN [Aptenodytes forsteri]|uniref:rho-related GTP-binding protein RhoN n=1 Tax=Aptenodytes forsteri TaxID=9233 RepID=UPI0004F40B86|nr:PREDICTED: rho-related GTP-binding protein RhoN [Aptenodytes forsteri]